MIQVRFWPKVEITEARGAVFGPGSLLRALGPGPGPERARKCYTLMRPRSVVGGACPRHGFCSTLAPARSYHVTLIDPLLW